MDIYLKPEEIERAVNTVPKTKYPESSIILAWEAVAKASADNAVRVIIEYLEQFEVGKYGTTPEGTGTLAVMPNDWQALKKLISKEVRDGLAREAEGI